MNTNYYISSVFKINFKWGLEDGKFYINVKNRGN